MYAEERQEEILRLARAQGRVDVTALADDLRVTAETIRRDLTVLERAGVLRRVHGGAIPVERIGFEPALAARDSVLITEKERIAKAALAELPDEGAVILDAGSTTARLAAGAARRPRAVRRGQLAGRWPPCSAPGPTSPCCCSAAGSAGKTLATVDDWALRPLADMYVDVAFMGTNGCSVERGLTTPDPAEATVKRAMIAAARRVVAARRPHQGRQRLPGPVRRADRPRRADHRQRPRRRAGGRRRGGRRDGWSAHDRHRHAQPEPGPGDRDRRAGPGRRDPRPSGPTSTRAARASTSPARCSPTASRRARSCRAAATRARSSSACSRARASTWSPCRSAAAPGPTSPWPSPTAR